MYYYILKTLTIILDFNFRPAANLFFLQSICISQTDQKAVESLLASSPFVFFILTNGFCFEWIGWHLKTFSKRSSLLVFVLSSNFKGRNLSVPGPSQLIMIPPKRHNLLFLVIQLFVMISSRYWSKRSYILKTRAACSHSDWEISST